MTDDLLPLKDHLSSAKARVRGAELLENFHMDAARHAYTLYRDCLERVEQLEKELAFRKRDAELAVNEPKGFFGWIR